MTATAITGTILSPDGEAYADKRVFFSRQPNAVSAASGGVVAPQDIVATTNSSGAISLSLYPGVYRMSLPVAQGRRMVLVTVPVSASPVDLADLLP